MTVHFYKPKERRVLYGRGIVYRNREDTITFTRSGTNRRSGMLTHTKTRDCRSCRRRHWFTIRWTSRRGEHFRRVKTFSKFLNFELSSIRTTVWVSLPSIRYYDSRTLFLLFIWLWTSWKGKGRLSSARFRYENQSKRQTGLQKQTRRGLRYGPTRLLGEVRGGTPSENPDTGLICDEETLLSQKIDAENGQQLFRENHSTPKVRQPTYNPVAGEISYTQSNRTIHTVKTSWATQIQLQYIDEFCTGIGVDSYDRAGMAYERLYLSVSEKQDKSIN